MGRHDGGAIQDLACPSCGRRGEVAHALGSTRRAPAKRRRDASNRNAQPARTGQGSISPAPRAAAISCSADAASTIRVRNASAVSCKSLPLTGRSPLMKRRMERSSMPRRRDEAVTPPNTCTQCAKCSEISCGADDTVLVLPFLPADGAMRWRSAQDRYGRFVPYPLQDRK